MAAPYELLATPFDVFLAAAGTAAPAIDATPSGGWVKLGTRGADEYDEAGISVAHQQTVDVYRGLRGTGPIKAFRTSEGLTLSFELNDLTLESYAKILNDSDVDSSTDPIARRIGMHQGPQVATFALLAKSDDGPYGDDLPVQYYVPKVYQGGSPTVVHKKGKPAGLALEFVVLEDLDAATEEERFGYLEAQDTAGS
jgi:hypothetical protein